MRDELNYSLLFLVLPRFYRHTFSVIHKLPRTIRMLGVHKRSAPFPVIVCMSYNVVCGMFR